ncbi:MAG: Mur ligase family protein [Bacteroidales bacterium]
MKSQIESLYAHFLKHPLITTDSRNVAENSIFFALRGENFDGNKFADTAIQAGASFAVVDDPHTVNNERYVLVDNVLNAMQNLAAVHRQNFKGKIIGITGSNGKTTTKELIYKVLSSTFKTQATKGNLNNHIGVPLTLLSFPNDLEVGIVEMGANHIGEIDALCTIAKPDYGLITNIEKHTLRDSGALME